MRLVGLVTLSLFTAIALLAGCGGGGVGGGVGPVPPPIFQPPPAPTGLSATPGNSQVTLTWNPSPGAATYVVRRSITSGSGYAQIGTPSAATFVDTTAVNGATYFYVVSAVNPGGESATSAETSSKPAGSTAITVTIDPLANRHAINPNIYGGSYPKDAATVTDSGMTLVRWGGNATSRYNWKTFSYNSANDYYFSDYLTSEIGDSDSTQFVKHVAALKANPLMTLGMLDWVSKSGPANSNGEIHSFSIAKYGAQCKIRPNGNNAADAGNGQKPDCTTNVTGNDPNDANVPLLDDPGVPCPASAVAVGNCGGTVYRSQWAAALAASYGSAPHLYNLDNEMDIWSGTHRDVHPNPVTYNEARDTYLRVAGNLKTIDPAAIRLGPVSCCWYFYWRSAAGGGDTASHGGVDFLPWWLNEVAWADAVKGSRSLEIFDIHAYPDGPDTTGFSVAQKQAATLRVYRDWWDPNYSSEAKYIVGGGFSMQAVDSRPFRLPRMRAMINTIYPGTQFSVTEWSAAFAGEADFSTALADVEGYGLLGRERVDLASRWTTPDPANLNYQALKLYRNYDDSHSTFGTTSIAASAAGSDPNLFSVYAALDSTGNSMTVMVVNKDPAKAAQLTFSFKPGFTASQYKTFTLSQSSPTAIVAGPLQAWSATQTFAPYTATLLVITGTGPGAVTDWDLNPAAIDIPAGGKVGLRPHITAGSATVTLGTPVFDSGISAMAVDQPTLAPAKDGAITVTAGSTPGLYHYTAPGTDTNGIIQKQDGWIIVENPAATLSAASGSGAAGSVVTLTATLTPGASGGTSNGASILFSADSGTLAQRIVTTDGAGKASVLLTLPAAGTVVHVTGEGPYGLGHPVVTFTETSQ